jgi:hypothetical protein
MIFCVFWCEIAQGVDNQEFSPMPSGGMKDKGVPRAVQDVKIWEQPRHQPNLAEKATETSVNVGYADMSASCWAKGEGKEGV